VFEELRRKNRLERAPVKEVFRISLRPLLCAWGARLGDNSLAYIYESFVIVYATQQLTMTRDTIVTALMLAAAAQVATVPLFGWVSDKIGRRPVYMLGAVLSALAVFPFFAMLQTKDLVLVYVALFMVSAVAKTMMTSAQSPWLAEMFPARTRYTGFALAREVTSPIAGGIAPLIAVALLSVGHGSPHLVAWYVVGLSIVAAVSVYLGPETRDSNIETGANPAADSKMQSTSFAV
jgi:MFS transporter, MHS family, shikimate and dehydroshikimate transport protein